MITKRDFFNLNSEELKYKDILDKSNGVIDGKLFASMPMAVLIHKSLFPNQCLHSYDLDYNNEKKYLNELKLILDNEKSNEMGIVRYIKTEYIYYVIGSLLRYYPFGHHDSFIFPEFSLPPNFRCDYLIVGNSSQGHEFVFVELESVHKEITLKDGEFGNSIRKGIKQVEDWKNWLESNFHHLKLVFEKHLGKYKTLPKEFLTFDSSRMHYIVLSGRRSHFSELTYKNARKSKKDKNTLILHYDNLLDSTERILKNKNYI